MIVNKEEQSRKGLVLIFTVYAIVILGLGIFLDVRNAKREVITPAELHSQLRDCYARHRHPEIIRNAKMEVVAFNCINYAVE